MFPKWLNGKYVAHRGLHNQSVSQNTIEAFKNAIDNDYNIELDVQLTKDKVAVVVHDFHLGNLTGTDMRVNDLSFKELQAVKYKTTGNSIPTFEEVLRLCEGKTGLMIEVKKLEKNLYPLDFEMEEIITPILRNYKGDFIVKSFSPQCLKWFLDNTDFICGLLSDRLNLSDYDDQDRPVVHDIIYGAKHIDFFDYNAGLIGSNFWNEVSAIMPCVLWTIRNEQKFEEVKNKVANLIFEGFLPKNRA